MEKSRRGIGIPIGILKNIYIFKEKNKYKYFI